jgi:hypothetical protein
MAKVKSKNKDVYLNDNEIFVLEEFANENSFKIRLDYSGRGMFGKNCVGFVGQSLDDIKSELIEYIRDNFEGHSKLISKIKNGKTTQFDSMGLDDIAYFPSLEVNPNR